MKIQCPRCKELPTVRFDTTPFFRSHGREPRDFYAKRKGQTYEEWMSDTIGEKGAS